MVVPPLSSPSPLPHPKPQTSLGFGERGRKSKNPEGGSLEGGGPEAERPNPEKVGVQRGGCEGPKFRAFFPAPVANFVLSSLSGGLVRGIVAAVQGRGPPKVPVSASLGSFCEAQERYVVTYDAPLPRITRAILDCSHVTGTDVRPSQVPCNKTCH